MVRRRCGHRAIAMASSPLGLDMVVWDGFGVLLSAMTTTIIG
jgi:hypothetical protein